jgi:hypothetical protein
VFSIRFPKSELGEISVHQIRIFTGIEGDTARLAKDVNDWLRQSKVKVVNVFGNIAPQSALERHDPGRIAGAETGPARRFAPSDVMLVVVYEE